MSSVKEKLSRFLGDDAVRMPEQSDSRMKDGTSIGKHLVLETQLFPRLIDTLLNNGESGFMSGASMVMIDASRLRDAAVQLGAEIDSERREKRQKIIEHRRSLIGRKRRRGDNTGMLLRLLPG